MKKNILIIALLALLSITVFVLLDKSSKISKLEGEINSTKAMLTKVHKELDEQKKKTNQAVATIKVQAARLHGDKKNLPDTVTFYR